jgi:pimeloyl-ACP methyl ester carboxylesterase
MSRQPVHPFARKAGKVMLIAVSIPLFGALLLLCLLVYWSPGRPAPFLDADGNPLPGGISEKVWVTINGVEQGMFIKGKDVTNPVLLFLHGGPGMPEHFLTQRYPTGLEEYFTVVWWEQRGAGLSYDPGLAPESMTIEQFIADTLEVTRYLRSRFGQDKIYLMGHSWGSFIGIQAAARAPELYHAYIGVSQIAYQLRSENLAYAYMLEQFKANGNTRMVRLLEEAPVTMSVPLPPAYDAARDEAMHSLGIGTTHDMTSVITGIFLPSWRWPEYTLGEKVNLWRGKIFSRGSGLWNEMLSTDLTATLTALDLPVYFMHGAHDYTVAYPLAQAYCATLTAPVKGFYTFDQSAHSPMFEEPEATIRILLEDVLAGTNALADPAVGELNPE